MENNRKQSNIENIRKGSLRREKSQDRRALAPFRQFHCAMDQLFEDFLTDFSSPMLGMQRAFDEEDFFVPKMDIKVSDNKYEVHIEAPGVDKKDVKLQIRDGILTISGNRRREIRDEKEDIMRTEISYGSFQRSMQLPEDAKEDSIEAQFKDGILNLTIPRSLDGGKSAKTIEIN